MFEMFPFLFNNLIGYGSNLNNNTNNYTNSNNYDGNLYSGNTNNGNYKYGTFTNGNDIINVFSGSFIGTFSSVFNEVFTTLISNEELIDNIVESVLNNDIVNSIIEVEEGEDLNLDFRDYGDRYLIEGKLQVDNKNDIDIDYENDHISIKVKRDDFKNSEMNIAMLQDKNYIEKTFYVPRVDTKRIQAVYNANVLRIYLKKLPEVDEGTTIIDVDDYTNASK